MGEHCKYAEWKEISAEEYMQYDIFMKLKTKTELHSLGLFT